MNRFELIFAYNMSYSSKCSFAMDIQWSLFGEKLKPSIIDEGGGQQETKEIERSIGRHGAWKISNFDKNCKMTNLWGWTNFNTNNIRKDMLAHYNQID